MARKVRGIVGADSLRWRLIGGLTLAGGGFDLSDRHIAGLAVWLVVVAAAGARRGGRGDAGAAVLLGQRD